MITKRNCNLPLICLVCGDTARGINFNVMSCLSCKTFFRRHANKRKVIHSCLLGNNCEISQKTRSQCTACRLRKCFTLGMNPKIIGNRRLKVDQAKCIKQIKINSKQKPIELPQLCTPLNLLQNDRSTLSRDEWNLLSNVIHAYDSTDIIPQTRQLFQSQSMLPLKVAVKPSIMFDIFKQLHSGYVPLLRCTPYFHKLCPNLRKQLIQYNYRIFGMFYSGLTLREINAMNYSSFRTGVSLLHTDAIGQHLHIFVSRLESNTSVVKVLLMILMFSTSCGIVSFDPMNATCAVENSIPILNVQNIIVTMLWKYLLYQYGFVSAVQRFSCQVKCILDLIYTARDCPNSQVDAALYSMIADAKRALVIED